MGDAELRAWAVDWAGCGNPQAQAVLRVLDENKRLRATEADAAHLRRVFTGAIAELQRIRHMNDDEEAIWRRMYEAVRDTQGGLAVLGEVARLEAEMAAVEPKETTG